MPQPSAKNQRKARQSPYKLYGQKSVEHSDPKHCYTYHLVIYHHIYISLYFVYISRYDYYVPRLQFVDNIALVVVVVSVAIL